MQETLSGHVEIVKKCGNYHWELEQKCIAASDKNIVGEESSKLYLDPLVEPPIIQPETPAN